MKRLDLSVLSPKVLDLLRRIGVEADRVGVKAFLVGGMVRDLLLNQASVDVDVVVEGDGFVFARQLTAKLKAEAVFHDRFKTAALTLVDGTGLDVVTARRETYARGGALPDIMPATIKEDLLRRDFTINALAMSLNVKTFGILRDETGGREDLEAHLIRVMHEFSFVDDPTRILRAARYAVRLGFQFDALTNDLLEQAVAADVFKSLTPARYFLELSRILEEQDPVPALDLLAAWGAVRYIPYDAAIRSRLAAAVTQGTGDWPRRLGLILKGLLPARIDEIGTAFNISRAERLKIALALQEP